MKKRLFAVLMTVCLMLTLAPAAFAVDSDTGRPIPTELPIVYENEAVAPASATIATEYPGTGTQDDPIVIDIDEDSDFQYLINDCASYTGKYYDVNLTMPELDLSHFTTPSEWGGYLKYFMGSFDGNNKTISNIPKNCYLFFQIHDADIGNFTLDLGGEAGTLLYYTFQINRSTGVDWGVNSLHDIDVVSNTTIQLTGNDQANYAPFLFASGPYFTMNNCNNYANISGNTYAAVFHGYYILPASGYPADCYFNMSNCENHGDISLRYAGLIFGNPTGLRENRNITLTNIKNYGEIRGTETKHFFSSDAGANGYFTPTSFFTEKENLLDPKDESGNFLETSPMRLHCENADCLRDDDHTGSLCQGMELTGFAVSVDSETSQFVVTPAQNDTDVAEYYVTAYRYVNLYDETGHHRGTSRISYSEQVTSPDYSTAELMDMPLRDGVLVGTLTDDAMYNRFLYYGTSGETSGFWLNNVAAIPGNEEGEFFYPYIVNPDTPGEVEWVVYASAYDANKNLLDTVSLVRTAE